MDSHSPIGVEDKFHGNDIKRMDFKPKTTQDQQKSWTNFKGLCKGCGLCIEKCPVKCIAWDKETLGVYGTPSVKVDIQKCIACGTCELICPDSAIKVEKRLKGRVAGAGVPHAGAPAC